MALIFAIKVIPSSGKMQWSLDKAGNLKAHLKSPPEKGLANKELIKELSKALKIAQSEVDIIKGATTRHKTVRINSSLTKEQLLNALGIEQNLSLL